VNVHQVAEIEVSSEERMDFVLDVLSKRGQVPFFELIAGAQRIVIVVTFVAILELMKELKIFVKQVGSDGEIWVYPREGVAETPEAEDVSQPEASEDV
jgi:segregation and condensation protein A